MRKLRNTLSLTFSVGSVGAVIKVAGESYIIVAFGARGWAWISFCCLARANNIQSFRYKALPLRPRKRPQRSISRTFYANIRPGRTGTCCDGHGRRRTGRWRCPGRSWYLVETISGFSSLGQCLFRAFARPVPAAMGALPPKRPSQRWSKNGKSLGRFGFHKFRESNRLLIAEFQFCRK